VESRLARATRTALISSFTGSLERFFDAERAQIALKIKLAKLS
jgi:hypothetical protein